VHPIGLSDDSKLQESHDRKVAALSRSTKLVIGDIPILFRRENDFALKKFCKKVVLPNTKHIIWQQKEIVEWTHQSRGLADRQVLKPIFKAVPVCRASMFRNVLPAEGKHVCVQVPTSGLFQNLGPEATVSHRSIMVKRYTVRTFDRIMEYISALSGRVDLRIHQPVNNRFLSLANIPATYSFYKNRSDQPAQTQIVTAYQRTMYHHILPLVRLHHLESWENLFPDLVELLESRIPKSELRTRAMKAVYGWAGYWKMYPGVKRRDVFMVLTRDLFQAADALGADSKSRCPCCGLRGYPV